MEKAQLNRAKYKAIREKRKITIYFIIAVLTLIFSFSGGAY